LPTTCDGRSPVVKPHSSGGSWSTVSEISDRLPMGRSRRRDGRVGQAESWSKSADGTTEPNARRGGFFLVPPTNSRSHRVALRDRYCHTRPKMRPARGARNQRRGLWPNNFGLEKSLGQQRSSAKTRHPDRAAGPCHRGATTNVVANQFASRGDRKKPRAVGFCRRIPSMHTATATSEGTRTPKTRR